MDVTKEQLKVLAEFCGQLYELKSDSCTITLDVPDSDMEVDVTISYSFHKVVKRPSAEARANMTEELLANAYIKGASDLLQGKIEGMPKIVVIPDGATNGDMIKTMFPNLQVVDVGVHRLIVTFLDCYNIMSRSSIDMNWWNAPYKAESEG